jgi:hypothetical protein
MIHFLQKSGWQLDQTRSTAGNRTQNGTMLDVCLATLGAIGEKNLAQSNKD